MNGAMSVRMGRRSYILVNKKTESTRVRFFRG